MGPKMRLDSPTLRLHLCENCDSFNNFVCSQSPLLNSVFIGKKDLVGIVYCCFPKADTVVSLSSTQVPNE